MITHSYDYVEYAEDQEDNVTVMAAVDDYDDNDRTDITLWDADGDAITLTKAQYRALTRFVDNTL